MLETIISKCSGINVLLNLKIVKLAIASMAIRDAGFFSEPLNFTV